MGAPSRVSAYPRPPASVCGADGVTGRVGGHPGLLLRRAQCPCSPTSELPRTDLSGHCHMGRGGRGFRLELLSSFADERIWGSHRKVWT